MDHYSFVYITQSPCVCVYACKAKVLGGAFQNSACEWKGGFFMSKRACYVLLNSYIVIWLVVDEERSIWERRKGGGGLRRVPKYNYQKSAKTKFKDSRHRRGKSTGQQTSSLFCRATDPNALNRRMLLAVNYDMIPIHPKG